jgi:hypothetical protein
MHIHDHEISPGPALEIKIFEEAEKDLYAAETGFSKKPRFRSDLPRMSNNVISCSVRRSFPGTTKNPAA